MESIHFRNGTKKDIGVLAELFRETVCRINSRDYSPEQIAAWTGGATPKRWDGLFSGALRFILAERDTDGAILGFTAVDRGYLHSLFVHAEYQSRGIGSGLLEQAEAYAHMQGAVRITSEVSLTARPFFERKGYRVDREQQIDRGGVLLTNFYCQKCFNLKTINFVHIIHLLGLKIQFFVQKNVIFMLKNGGKRFNLARNRYICQRTIYE